MKLLLDQDVWAETRRFLEGLGHDVISASDLGTPKATDAELLARAREMERLFVTRDRDFGRLVVLEHRGPGVLYLRMRPTTVNAAHDELLRVLARYDESDLSRALVVVEPGGHRIRRLRPRRP